jgi:hypothetical protein
MARRMKLKITIMAFIFASTFNCYATQKANIIESNVGENVIVIKNGKHRVLNKVNLDGIKHAILERAQTCTWSNMYNNNPCFDTAYYQFYLNPDPGGPHNHIQWNIDCDPRKGDFNTLVIVQKNTENTIRTHLINTVINFSDSNAIRITPYSAQATFPSAAAVESSKIAVTELLQAIRKPKKGVHSSPLAALVIKVGMPRLEIETIVSKITGSRLIYSPHSHGFTNEQGLKAIYSDGVSELRVQYAVGAPSYRIKRTPSGPEEHLPAKDQTVIRWQLIKLFSNTVEPSL